MRLVIHSQVYYVYSFNNAGDNNRNITSNIQIDVTQVAAMSADVATTAPFAKRDAFETAFTDEIIGLPVGGN